jgi:hypothetical protein
MSVVQLISPYATEGIEWLKGNLHTHTTFSDGKRAPEVVIADYQQRGYDFLAISDHDYFTSPADYQAGTSLVLIPAVEVTAMGPHMLQLGLHERLEPDANRQLVLDEINKRGGLAVLNHPNWEWTFNHFPQEMMQDLTGAIGMEVYNGVIERLEGTALASDRWDRLLSINHWLWGFANDDSHYAEDVGIAWNVVQVPTGERNATTIFDALRGGRFYGSTGVQVDEISVDGRKIHIRTRNAQRIRFITRWGNIRASVDDAEATWEIPGDPKTAQQWRYVRAECYGAGGQMAWTQPARIDVQ